MIIKETNDEQEKKGISTSILESLPNWFGIQESIQEYISESSNLPFFAAIDESKSLDESYPDVNYAGTRKFYETISFKPLECLPELWEKTIRT
ncbi:MAG: hypothetical protein GX962_12790 [Epulopiscium sp.]|nr:hypothetical protein [Candidatus Epulonipiscium sp.]